MNFAALALALLLAVGSQAASLQADAPIEVQQIRSAVGVSLEEFKQKLLKIVNQLDDTEYSVLKTNMVDRVEQMFNYIQGLRDTLAPITDGAITTISDATADFRSKVRGDIENLQTRLAGEERNAREVINRHIADYYAMLKPILEEYQEKHNVEMEAFRAKLDPVLESLRVKIDTNMEETKTALMPIMEAVSEKLSENLDRVKEQLQPYADEYKDRLSQGIHSADMVELQNKLKPLAIELKGNLQSIFDTVLSSVTGN